MRDLDELRERLAWCRAKMDALKPEISVARKRSFEIRMTDPEHGMGFVMGKMLAEPPTRFRIEVGLVAHEQRAILDALACTLATRNGANNIKDVYFPISKDSVVFAGDGRKKIRKLSAAHQDAIEALEPWQDGHDFLYLLHDADRTRKHQKLLGWQFTGDASPRDGRGMQLVSHALVFEAIGREEKLARYLGFGEIGVNIQLIYVDPSSIQGENVLRCLTGFQDSVEAIVQIFD